MKLLLLGCSLAVAVFAPGAPARADAAGDAVLRQMDAALNHAKTLQLEYQITNQQGPEKAERSLAMNARFKGDKSLFEFTAPADLKGTRLLVLSAAQAYVYLPAFGKVRRVATNLTDRGFMGLTFAVADLATTAFGPRYEAAIASQDAASWRLVLTPKPGQQTSHARVEVTVGKDNKLPRQLDYFDAAGKNVKTETRAGYSCEGEVCTAGERKMVDHATGSWTSLSTKSRKLNQEIPDGVFSQRSLGE